MATVRLLALDSDGVLTDGGVFVAEDGKEYRRFDIKDGLGLRRVLDAGIKVVVLSSSLNVAVQHRAAALGIQDAYVGVVDKAKKLVELCDGFEIPLGDTCYIGDDITDLEVINTVGFSCAPADAVAEVRSRVDYVAQANGGHGAVREICDLLANGVTDRD